MAKEKDSGKKKEKKIIVKTNIVLKKKKKKWVSIVAPKEFGGMELGESFVAEASELKGRKIDVSLSNLGRGKNSSIKLIFEVDEITEGKGIVNVIGYYIMDSFARRIIRKGRTKINGVYKSKTKDNINVTLKLVLCTQNIVPTRISKPLRAETEKIVADFLKNNTFPKILDSVIMYQFQKNLKKDLSKIYPVASLEVLSFKKAF